MSRISPTTQVYNPSPLLLVPFRRVKSTILTRLVHLCRSVEKVRLISSGKIRICTMISVKGLGRSFLNTWILLILLFSPLLVHALDDEPLAKGGRGGGGGRGSSGSGRGKGVKMIKLFGKLNVALWVVIVVGGEHPHPFPSPPSPPALRKNTGANCGFVVVIGLLALCCLFCLFSFCCSRGKKTKNAGARGISTVEAGQYHKMQDQPFLPPGNAPPYNPQDVYHPPAAYQGGAYGEKPGEAAQYYNQPYGQGGLGYMTDKGHPHDASVSSQGSQVHHVPYPPWGAAGQR
ncbi:hypothetical protein CPB86DRAFT_868875 [Serendipita vermifera]|nr:hypothetical protein CPB86DRAFT_868875 [Serendipita vermifera]